MKFVARAFALGALLLALAALAPAAAAKTILFIAPHPDDETLVSGGRIREAVLAGDSVKVVIFTNGDIGGVESGLQRQGESVAAAQLLGLGEQDVIFLGYPDAALMDIYRAPSPSDVITSPAGRTSTYGARGMGGMDYHSFRFGSPGPYNRVTVEQDIRTLISEFRPDEIYTVTHFDTHPDHQTTALFVADALVALQRSGAALATKLHQGIVWPPNQATSWPGSGGCAPDTPFPDPRMENPLEWKRILRSVVVANLKCQAISQYPSQATPHLLSFARKDEFSWMSDFGANLALTAEVTASSESVATNQGRLKAVDGVVDGAQHDASREWVTAGELGGAWIQLAWPAPVTVAQVNLHDRPRGPENVIASTLSFSDGTSINVGALPWDGKMLPVTFAPKTVTWVRFTIDLAEGSATGLAEIQVLGQPAQSSANLAPHFLEGPGGAEAVTSPESANLSVLGHDLNGDAVQYEWSADGGTINASGPNAVFTPPAVSASTVFTIAVQILDGRGGSASNVTFVTVAPGSAPAPAIASLSLSPATVAGGASATGTVTLSAAAPEGGAQVALSSSNPAASVPASVTVAAGATSATFNVTTSPVPASTAATISASYAGATQTASLTVTPAGAASLAVSPAAVTGGSSATGTVTLSGPAPAGGTQVALSSNNAAAMVPASVTVAAGQASATFTVTTLPVASSTSATISASASGATRTATLTVGPPVPTSLGMSPAAVTGGGASTGSVTLSGPAPAGGVQVALSGNDAAASVPASVTVPAWQTTATFTVTTTPVANSTAVTISASYGGTTRNASLTVLPPAVSSLALSPTSVLGGPLGNSTGTVSLNAPAPAGGAQIALTSSSGAASVPSSVTVPAGATQATFTINTELVLTTTDATVTASYKGSSRSATLQVRSALAPLL